MKKETLNMIAMVFVTCALCVVIYDDLKTHANLHAIKQGICTPYPQTTASKGE